MDKNNHVRIITTQHVVGYGNLNVKKLKTVHQKETEKFLIDIRAAEFVNNLKKLCDDVSINIDYNANLVMVAAVYHKRTLPKNKVKTIKRLVSALTKFIASTMDIIISESNELQLIMNMYFTKDTTNEAFESDLQPEETKK